MISIILGFTLGGLIPAYILKHYQAYTCLVNLNCNCKYDEDWLD